MRIRAEGDAVRLLVVVLHDVGRLDGVEPIRPAFLVLVSCEPRESRAVIEGSVTTLLEGVAGPHPALGGPEVRPPLRAVRPASDIPSAAAPAPRPALGPRLATPAARRATGPRSRAAPALRRPRR